MYLFSVEVVRGDRLMSVVSEQRQFQHPGRTRSRRRTRRVSSSSEITLLLGVNSRASREAFYFYFCGRTYVTYVRPVALSARHVFFIVGHPVAAAALC